MRLFEQFGKSCGNSGFVFLSVWHVSYNLEKVTLNIGRLQMKYMQLSTVVMMSILFSLPALANDEEERDFDSQMRQMELSKRQSEMDRENRRAENELQMQELEIDRVRAEIKGNKCEKCQSCSSRRGCPFMRVVFGILCLVVNILLATWVFQDAGKRGISGIWIAIVLLTGLFGMIPYAIIRLGNEELEEE